jgi:hypothetical protein
MAEVIDYPDDPLRTFPTGDPHVRRVEFGDAGLITYLINDGAWYSSRRSLCSLFWGWLPAAES